MSTNSYKAAFEALPAARPDESSATDDRFDIGYTEGWNGYRQALVDRLNLSPVSRVGQAQPSNSELMELSRECAAMPGGSGMLYANYGREVLRRWGALFVSVDGVGDLLAAALRKIMEAHRFNVASMPVTEVHSVCFDALAASVPNHSEREVVLEGSVPSIKCWSCKLIVSLDDRADADGSCPHCSVELDLEDYLRAMLAAGAGLQGATE